MATTPFSNLLSIFLPTGPKSSQFPPLPSQISSQTPPSPPPSLSFERKQQQKNEINGVDGCFSSVSSELTAVMCPSLAYANTMYFNSAYNVQVVVEENEPEERLVNRFRREVMRAGFIQEVKRRRYFENKQDEAKRRTRDAAKRNSRRRNGESNLKQEQELDRELNRVRREERERGAAERDDAIRRVESKFQEQLKQREKEQQQLVIKLEQQEKKCSSLVQSLRSDLEETRQQLVTFDKRVAHLESQVLEEQQVSASWKIKAQELENDIQRLTKELNGEKAKREEALAKIVGLEHVISATTRDLDSERQRLKDARGKITILEKQLRAFCTMAEEIQHSLDKQQEKLEEMHKALQDEQIDQINESTEVDPTQIVEHDVDPIIARDTETTSHASNGTMEPVSASSFEREGSHVGVEASNDIGETRT